MRSRQSPVASHQPSRSGIFWIAPLAAVVLMSVAASGVTFKQATLTIMQDSRRVVLRVEVADTPASRAQGLMFRRQLVANAGMLFIFEDTGSWSFWMKNTLIPLSIAFIDQNWRIVDIKDMQVAPDPEQGPFEYYASAKPFKYALEVNQGFFRRKGIITGARVVVSPR